jgi:hypothetical protein
MPNSTSFQTGIQVAEFLVHGSNTVPRCPVNPAIDLASIKAEPAVDAYIRKVACTGLFPDGVLCHPQVLSSIMDVHEPLPHTSHTLEPASDSIGKGFDEAVTRAFAW